MLAKLPFQTVLFSIIADSTQYVAVTAQMAICVHKGKTRKTSDFSGSWYHARDKFYRIQKTGATRWWRKFKPLSSLINEEKNS